MFQDLSSYPSLARSGIPWAPNLPSHWRVARGKSLFMKMDRQPSPDDGVVTCFRDGVVTLRSRRRTTGFTEALQEIGYQGVRKGDLVIHAMDAFAGAVGVSDSDGKSSPVYGVCLPRRDANVCYYAAVVREMARSSWILALSKGIRERSTDFRFETFGAQVLPAPPPAEQAAIVKYLTHANARIDSVIAAKLRLLRLLEERTQVAIESAVTRGLGPMPDLKPTGLMWLPRAPAHWGVRRAKYLLRTIDVRSATGREERLTVSSARGVIRRSETTVYMFAARTYVGHKLCWPGDLVINCLWAWGGGLGVARDHGIVSTAYGVYRVRDPQVLNPQYLHLLVRSRSYSHELQVQSRGVWKSRLQLTDDRFLATGLVMPPIEEQRAIVEFADDRRAAVAPVMDKLKREIELLQEFRTRLAGDLVTGAVDVRSAAAALGDIDLETSWLDRETEDELDAAHLDDEIDMSES